MTANDYFVRVAIPDDASGITALLQASYPSLLKPAYDRALLESALPLITKANPELLESGTLYVAQARDELIVGCGGWTAERPGDGVVQPGVGHVRHFATHAGWTRLGVGRAIFGTCETTARSAGIVSLECYSTLNAESFYAAQGFERVRLIDVRLGAAVMFPGVLMRLRIDGDQLR